MPRTVKMTASAPSGRGRDCTAGFLHHPLLYRQERQQHVTMARNAKMQAMEHGCLDRVFSFLNDVPNLL